MTHQSNGRSLELYFIDGRPDGMLTAEVFNWTGHLLMAPRTQVGDALARKEARYTGVYLLLGERDGLPLAYIGEAEDMSARLRNHEGKKEWWNSVVLITSAANNLNKAHVKYLEARLVEIARTVGRVPLDNGTTPALPSLTEAATANMEAFLEYVLMVLPALRVDIFVSNKRPSVSSELAEPSHGQVFELLARRHGIAATAIFADGEFIVQKGSQARLEWTGPTDHSYAQSHAELVRMGVIAPRGSHREFVTNYAFKSPSAAAAAVNGRPSNGTLDWRLKGTKKTYKEWEAEELARGSEELP